MWCAYADVYAYALVKTRLKNGDFGETSLTRRVAPISKVERHISDGFLLLFVAVWTGLGIRTVAELNSKS